MLIFAGILILLQYSKCSLESDMLKRINRYRIENIMEELYSLPSLQKAADEQALHMCRISKLTHDGPKGDMENLSGRLRRFNFFGLNVGENIAKQEGNDYKEVFRLWTFSKEHRNNILGDYVYSGVATCVGSDNNRYWVQVFGKDVSNARIARIRNKFEDLREKSRMEYEENFCSYSTNGRCGETKDFRKENVSSDKMNPANLREEYPKEEYLKIPFDPGSKQGKVEYKHIKNLLSPDEGTNHNTGQKEAVDTGSRGDKYLCIKFVHENKPTTERNHVQKINSTGEDNIVYKTDADENFVNFGGYLLPEIFRRDGQKPFLQSIPQRYDFFPVPTTTDGRFHDSPRDMISSDVNRRPFRTEVRDSTKMPFSAARDPIYLSKYPKLPEEDPDKQPTPEPHKQKAVAAEDLKSVMMKLLDLKNGNSEDDLTKQKTDPAAGFDSGNNNVKDPPQKRMEGKDKDIEDSPEKPTKEGLQDKQECSGERDSDGNCTSQKISDGDQLKTVLEYLMRRGMLHLHIFPPKKNCKGREDCVDEENIDIGVPLSYKQESP